MRKPTEETEQRYEPSVISVLATPDIPHPQFGKMLFVAHDPGAGNYFSALIQRLQGEARIYTEAKRKGEEVLSSRLPDKHTIPSLPTQLDWILVSACTQPLFELEVVQRAKQKNPKAKLVVAENTPGSISSMLGVLTQNGHIPDLVFTTTFSQVVLYKDEFGKELKNSRVVAVGQPDFDHLLTENTVKRSEEARLKLGIVPDALVVTYAGSPAADHAAITVDGRVIDPNSFTLQEVAQAVSQLATTYTDNHFVLINRPHPREIPELWQNPALLDAVRYKPTNFRVISTTEEGWKKVGMTTRDVCTAADVVAMIRSTVGQETAISGSRPLVSHRGSLPLHILIDGLTDHVKDKDARDIELAVRYQATGFATTREMVLPELDRCLTDTRYQERIRKGQRTLALDYGFGTTPSVERAYKALQELA